MPRADWLPVTVGALLMGLAYPPFHLLLPSFTCLVPAVWLLAAGAADERPLRRQLVQGFWFGLATSGVVLYWMVVALWHFTPLSAAGYAASIVVLGMWGAVLFGVVGWVHRRTKVSLLLVFPVVWTAVEWAIAHQGDVRFPWLGLGTSLTGYPVLVQVADLVGARGVTFLLALANTTLALAWVRRDRGRWWWPVGGVALGTALAAAYGTARMRTLPLRPVGRIVAVQPNVGFHDKWRPSLQDSVFRDLLDLSAEAITTTRPDLVLWPEAAVPGYFTEHPIWDLQVASQASRARLPILAGGLDLRVDPDGGFEYFNAAFLFDSTGRRDRQPPYRKRYLVPIVERVPFVDPRLFSGLRFFGGFGVGGPGPVYRTAIGRFGVLICYESAFEELSRDYRRRGADFVVNITNDAWFGRTTAPYQHAAHLVMRAIETRAGIARAANSGISGFVDPLGRVHERTALSTRAIVARELLTSDVTPPYVRLGDWVGWLSVAAVLALCLRAWRPRP